MAGSSPPGSGWAAWLASVLSKNKLGVGIALAAGAAGTFWYLTRRSRRDSPPRDDSPSTPQPPPTLVEPPRRAHRRSRFLGEMILLVITLLFALIMMFVQKDQVVVLIPGIYLFLRYLAFQANVKDEIDRGSPECSESSPCRMLPQHPVPARPEAKEHEENKDETLGMRIYSDVALSKIAVNFWEYPKGFDPDFFVFPEKFERTFKYPWEFTVETMWKRYPDPKKPKTIVSVLHEKTFDEIQCRIIHREFAVPNKAPFLLRAVFSADQVFADEKTIELATKKYLVMQAVNRSYRDVALTCVLCEFIPHPENSEWTMFRQQGAVKLGKAFQTFSGQIQNFAMSQFRKEGQENCDRLQELMEERKASGQ